MTKIRIKSRINLIQDTKGWMIRTCGKSKMETRCSITIAFWLPISARRFGPDGFECTMYVQYALPILRMWPVYPYSLVCASSMRRYEGQSFQGCTSIGQRSHTYLTRQKRPVCSSRDSVFVSRHSATRARGRNRALNHENDTKIHGNFATILRNHPRPGRPRPAQPSFQCIVTVSSSPSR